MKGCPAEDFLKIRRFMIMMRTMEDEEEDMAMNRMRTRRKMKV